MFFFLIIVSSQEPRQTVKSLRAFVILSTRMETGGLAEDSRCTDASHIIEEDRRLFH